MAVSRRLRFEILRRDGHTCRYCGAKAPEVPLTVDHVIPQTLGGSDDPNNLVTACQPCNSGKSSVPADAAIVEDVDAAAMLFRRAMEQAVVERRQRLEAFDEDLAWFRREWDHWGYGPDDDRKAIPLDPNWDHSIEMFVDAGLPIEEVIALIPVAMKSKAIVDEKWRYFCGCCWRTITDLQEEARRMIEDGRI